MEVDILKELCYAPILSRCDKINRLKTIGRKMPFGKYKGQTYRIPNRMSSFWRTDIEVI